jgi:hypothetical protein
MISFLKSKEGEDQFQAAGCPHDKHVHGSVVMIHLWGEADIVGGLHVHGTKFV